MWMYIITISFLHSSLAPWQALDLKSCFLTLSSFGSFPGSPLWRHRGPRQTQLIGKGSTLHFDKSNIIYLYSTFQTINMAAKLILQQFVEGFRSPLPIFDIAVQDKRKWMAETEHTPFILE